MRRFAADASVSLVRQLCGSEKREGYWKCGGQEGIPLELKPPTASLEQYRSVLEELQQTAMNRRTGIPLHFSFDQEGGTSADFGLNGVNFFPKPMGIRATGDPKYAYLVAKAVSR